MPDNTMERFDFMLGDWDLECRVPAGMGKGKGRIRRGLNDRIVIFDYTFGSTGSAHAVFAWDRSREELRFRWFEDSGAMEDATCRFIDCDTLFLAWDSGLVQTFQKAADGGMALRMGKPDASGLPGEMLEVIFHRSADPWPDSTFR